MSEPTEAEIFTRMIDSLKTAAGCATQMAHVRRDLRWIKVRGMLEGAVERITLLATKKLIQ